MLLSRAVRMDSDFISFPNRLVHRCVAAPTTAGGPPECDHRHKSLWRPPQLGGPRWRLPQLGGPRWRPPQLGDPSRRLPQPGGPPRRLPLPGDPRWSLRPLGDPPRSGSLFPRCLPLKTRCWTRSPPSGRRADGVRAVGADRPRRAAQPRSRPVRRRPSRPSTTTTTQWTWSRSRPTTRPRRPPSLPRRRRRRAVTCAGGAVSGAAGDSGRGGRQHPSSEPRWQIAG